MVSAEDEERSAVAFETFCGELSVGDEVIVNTTAVDLDLGTGGDHFILWNLTRKALSNLSGGRIMKLRYTPIQIDVRSAEEDPQTRALFQGNPHIDGTPVAVGNLHSQILPFVVTVKKLLETVRIAYVMTDGASLPFSLSRSATWMKREGLIDSVITVGNAFGGDLEAVNIFSGLQAAVRVSQADIVIVDVGPGVVGTNSSVGHSGMDQGIAINAVHSLMGRPIAIPRISFADERERHRGLSHHTESALGIAALARCDLPLPKMEAELLEPLLERLQQLRLHEKHDIHIIDVDDTEEILSAHIEKLSSMGRGYHDDPVFFKCAVAAGKRAVEMIKEG